MVAASIFDWARRTADKHALVFNGEPWSYRRFAAALTAARDVFIAYGCVGPGYAILTLAGGRDFWVASLALRSLGMTTVQVRNADEVGELRLPAVRCVVASVTEAPWPGLAERCSSQGLRLVIADLTTTAADPSLDDEPAMPSGGHILLTSGTTGRSKKLLIDPSFEAAFLARRRTTNGVTQNSVISVFDFGGWTGVGYKSPAAAWLAGATIVMHHGPDICQALRHPGLTHATLVPTMLAAVLAAPDGAYPYQPALRLSLAGGTVTEAQVAGARARICSRLFNSLGSTESPTYGLTELVTDEDRRWHRLVPGIDVQVVDENDQPLPTDALGRVRVAADGGPDGYLFDREATRTFFKHGYFYPGDLGVIRADGRLALHGRVTSVINMNGSKVQPEPIEDRLCAALGVTGICVLSMQDERGDEQLHVVIESPTPIDAWRLSSALRAALSGFPDARIFYAASLPRTPNGKIRRDAVRAQVASSA